MMRDFLFIGPVGGVPGRIGGTTVSFAHLIDWMGRHQQQSRIVGINRLNSRLLAALDCLLQCVLWVPQSRVVMLNVNPLGARFLAPPIRLYCAMWRKPFVFSMYGGDLAEIHAALSAPERWIMNHVTFSAELVLLQTRRLVDVFSAPGREVHWLPTSRPFPQSVTPRAYARRLVFISQVIRSKGVEWVLQLAQRRPDLHIDVYGPILEEELRYVESHQNYRGVLDPQEVTSTLSRYDVLLLPTQHSGEGYPGIIIEAMALGLPVVTTDWLAIPEIVRDGENGFLMLEASLEALAAAVERIDDNNYPALSKAAIESVHVFGADAVNSRLLRRLQALRDGLAPE